MPYPITAIYGQDEAKWCFSLFLCSQSIRNLLITGKKGTGKTLLARAMASHLGIISVVCGCPFNCDPEGEMCSGCTSSDALKRCAKKAPFIVLPRKISMKALLGYVVNRHVAPGILGSVNRGVLFIDCIENHSPRILHEIMKTQSAEMNVINGKYKHPAIFKIIATADDDEKIDRTILRRFDLVAVTTPVHDVEGRLEITRRSEEYFSDPVAFVEKYRRSEEKFANRVESCRKKLVKTKISRELTKKIRAMAGTDLRLRRVIADVARFNAIWEERAVVAEKDVNIAMKYVPALFSK